MDTYTKINAKWKDYRLEEKSLLEQIDFIADKLIKDHRTLSEKQMYYQLATRTRLMDTRMLKRLVKTFYQNKNKRLRLINGAEDINAFIREHIFEDMTDNQRLLTEDLDEKEKENIRELIRAEIAAVFFDLFRKKNIWI